MDHMTSDRWRTPSYSGGSAGECVQVTAKPSIGLVLVRDSKNPDGPILALRPADWCRFTIRVKPLTRHLAILS